MLLDNLIDSAGYYFHFNKTRLTIEREVGFESHIVCIVTETGPDSRLTLSCNNFNHALDFFMKRVQEIMSVSEENGPPPVMYPEQDYEEDLPF